VARAGSHRAVPIRGAQRWIAIGVKGESGLAKNIGRDGFNHVIGRSERLTEMGTPRARHAHSIRWTRIGGSVWAYGCTEFNPR
jgi:hypothetical protein